MKIAFVDVQNFRKLKSCRIDLSDRQTIFVGANNSGKTSAMDALITFFRSKELTTRDFTLSNWKSINEIGESWIKISDLGKLNLTISPWEEYLPTLDIWLYVEPDEIHYVSHLIPTLEWNGGLLGVRLRYEPKELMKLYTEFSSEFSNSKTLSSTPAGKRTKYKIWPKDLWDYLDRDKKISEHFTIRTYLLDPSLKNSPQKLPSNAMPLEDSAFNGLVKVDIINAQRGFSDVNTEGGDSATRTKNLSSQLRSYYDKHLNPSLRPTANDLEALKAIGAAKLIFDKNLQESFSASLSELEQLNYPGFGNPEIRLSSQFNAVDTLNHETSVLYTLNNDTMELSLPEKYNGLGYQNLISMIFKLIRFRDEWMQVGKVAKTSETDLSGLEFEPLHLVLIEEPEAHLHAQVQQVFIKEAYKVLRKNKNLGDKGDFTTQLVISTHSNHIAHEIDFVSLRYFKREIVRKGSIATSTVVNLSETFGSEDDTTRFANRYLKTTHCDLFFADAVILVEGPAEKMLMPYFIRHHSKLNACYISILEIGGSHAHTLRRLIENLGIITLIITDIDAADPLANNSKVQPDIGKGYVSGNETIKTWLPREANLDKLLVLTELQKEMTAFPIKVAYQTSLEFSLEKKKVAVYPYTFEDSIVMENRDIFDKIDATRGLLKKMVVAAKEKDIHISAKAMYDAITAQGVKKAEFALELLYLQEPGLLKVPIYIKEGLDWLERKLLSTKQGFQALKAKEK
jgi:predicted ATP-dependent endonuclease of OLD family